MNHTCITVEGGLLGPDFLEAIQDAEGQKASDFGLTGRRTLVDEVSAIWSDVRSYWDAFQASAGAVGRRGPHLRHPVSSGSSRCWRRWATN